MQARRTLAPGKKGPKKFLERYGEQLICVRYRYDEQRRKRFTTIEIIVEESGWSPPEKPVIVGLRVEFQETELPRFVKQADSKKLSLLSQSIKKRRSYWAIQLQSQLIKVRALKSIYPRYLEN